jgi:ATP-dependent DNA ligase
VTAVRTTSQQPKWIKPQLIRLVDEAPTGPDWVHEIKYDGYRMHARIDGGHVKLLTRTGLDWSHRYRRTIEASGSLRAKTPPACPVSYGRCFTSPARTRP